MRKRSTLAVGSLLAVAAAGVISSRALGQPTDLRGRLEPSIVRVEIEGLEAVRDLRFAGPIVQTIPSVTNPAPVRGAGGLLSTSDGAVLTGSLPMPPAVLAWFEASADGRPSTKNVSLVAVDSYAHEVWRWRFSDCTPTQMAYDPESRTWSMRLSAARMRHEIGAVAVAPLANDPLETSPAVEQGTPLAPRVTVVTGLVRVSLRAGETIDVTSMEPSAAGGQVVVTSRGGAKRTIAWTDVAKVEPVREVSSAR
jgi:hypothetical protein